VSSSSPASQFGPNEWLVEEMYEQFLADPSSVDPAWHDFFADYKPTQQRTQTTAATSTATGQTKTVTRIEPPAPESNGRAPAAAKPSPAPPKPTPARPAEQPVKKPAPAAKPAVAKPVAAAPPGEGDESKPIRGAAAAIVKNMELSLTVPTATSVRAVPAKLLFDNRIVINNRLKRTRGGKVSFTHLIGYALVKALESYPNMNRHFAMVDGKPTLVTPEHVNLGLAIDLPGKDGQRTLVWRPSRTASR
jgi:multifunctional 2-oxoglutarate metabolism enzyme